MYQLLLWNTNYFDPYLSLEEPFLKSQSVTINIKLNNLVKQAYQVKQIDFNRYNSALFYSYDKFRNVNILDQEIQQYVSHTTYLKIKAFDTFINESFEYFVNLDTNAVILLELIPYLSETT